jgi:hypothetical protein
MVQQFHSWAYTQRNVKSGYNKDTCTPMFITALFTIAKPRKQPRCSTTDKRIKKMWHLHTMEFYSATKRMNFCHFLVNG